MVLKSAPSVSGAQVREVIGKPVDYARNKEAGNFPDSYDLRIPGAGVEPSDEDLAGALDDIRLSSAAQRDEREYVRSD